MIRHASERSNDFIEKIIDMPVIVGISEFTEYAKGNVNELHMGRITKCFPFFSGRIIRNCMCVIVIDELLSIGNIMGRTLIVTERHVMGHPDVLLQGNSWIVYISLLKDGAEIPKEFTQRTAETLALGYGSVDPPEEWDILIEGINRNLKYMTSKERNAALKMKGKIQDYFKSRRHQ